MKKSQILLTTVFTVVFVLVGMLLMSVKVDNPEGELNYTIENGIEKYDIDKLDELTK